MKQNKKLCNKFLYFSVLFLIISLLVSVAMGAATEKTTKSSLGVVNTDPQGQCQNIHMQQRQIFEKMTRIEDQLDIKGIIE